MLGSVYFNNYFGIMAVKICNIIPNNFLPPESWSAKAQEIVP